MINSILHLIMKFNFFCKTKHNKLFTAEILVLDVVESKRVSLQVHSTERVLNSKTRRVYYSLNLPSNPRSKSFTDEVQLDI